MKLQSNRTDAKSLTRFNNLTLKRFNAVAVFLLALVIVATVRAQMLLPELRATHSVSDQFIILGVKQVSPFGRLPVVATNAEFVRLEPALLAISAERLKQSVWGELGVNDKWRGQVILALHPAQSLDETVTVLATRFPNGWSYRVELPDVVSRTRLARALTGTVLLELANRNAAGTRSADVPAWLIDGLAQEALANDAPGFIVTPPDKAVNGYLVNRVRVEKRGWDTLQGVHRVLRNNTALTFEQLSWPTTAQMSGNDGGVYRASAQLFVSQLLDLRNGPKNLRTMLQTLPRDYNWQTTFLIAFRENFSDLLDVEKWWALQVVSFVATDVGPQWTPAVSRDKLDEILRVPVQMRADSNSLPAHAEISLQGVIRNFDTARQTEILQAKLRDLEIAGLRMAPQLAGLAYDYHRVLADYLGQHEVATATTRRVGRQSVSTSHKSTAETLKRLDALDARRRAVEDAIKPEMRIR
jgi:hypothetical protein